MSKIMINKLDFHYVQYFNPVFEQVNLVLDTEWRLGLIGRNGRGKTTFLKLLKGDLEPDKGSIVKDVAMEYFPYQYQTDYRITLDVLKEIIGGLKYQEDQMEELLCNPTPESLIRYGEIQQQYQQQGGYEIAGRICKELYLMGLSEQLLERDFEQLSGGEKTKILMIAMFLRPNAFVLLDEPTNHLDLRGKQAVADYLRQKTGFLAVSHDRQFLDQVTDHILAINKSDITLEKGNYSSWRENKEKKEVFETRTKARLEKEVVTLERGALTRRNWAGIAEKEKNPYASHNRGAGSRAAKFMQQAKRAEQAAKNDLDRKKELLKNYETVPALHFLGSAGIVSEAEQVILASIEKLTFGYNGLALFQDFSMNVGKGERIWVKGSNGCGKSTLLKLLSGSLFTDRLKIREGVTISISYQEALWSEGYPADLIGDRQQWRRFLTLCGSLDITEEMLKRPIETYSSGEKGKLDLARSLSEESSILLLDEPLNYMDLYFREQLEQAILTVQPTLVFVEHDERFGCQVATRTIDLH